MNSPYISTPFEAQAVDRDAAEADAQLDAHLLGLAMVVIEGGGTPEDVRFVAKMQRAVFGWWKAWGPEILEQFRLAEADRSRRQLRRSLSRCADVGGFTADGKKGQCAVFQMSDFRRRAARGRASEIRMQNPLLTLSLGSFDSERIP
jgi:hypothetical protein